MNRSMPETLRAFEKGELAKPRFIETMHEKFHRGLFEYADRLSQVDVEEISIRPGEVVVTTRYKSLPEAQALRFHLDPDDHRVAPVEILNFGAYEPEEFQMMVNLIPGHGCLLDVGANIGFYALNLAAIFPEMRVHAFEPIPPTFGQLEKNVAINQPGNLDIHNFGLSEEKGTFDFYFYPEGSGNASLRILAERDGLTPHRCRVERLDDLWQEGAVTFMKIDVEGAELMVLKGACEVISTHKPVVFSEILRKWSKPFGYDPNDIFMLLTQMGYSGFVAKSGSLCPVKAMTENTQETNFFFLHGQHHRDLIDRYVRNEAGRSNHDG